jgi:hypothetical protein
VVRIEVDTCTFAAGIDDDALRAGIEHAISGDAPS